MIAAARHCSTAADTAPQTSSAVRRFSFRWNKNNPKTVPLTQIMVAASGTTSMFTEDISSSASPVGENDNEIVFSTWKRVPTQI